jgi:hypothetical protein
MTTYIRQDGTVKWEIISVDSSEIKIIYQVSQIVNARVIDFDNPYLSYPDTSFIVNELSFFNLIQDTEGFITFNNDNFFNRAIMLNRFYKTSKTYISLYTGLDGHADSNLVAIDYEWHSIKLRLNVGIDTWIIRNTHNGGPQGSLSLKDYVMK